MHADFFLECQGSVPKFGNVKIFHTHNKCILALIPIVSIPIHFIHEVELVDWAFYVRLLSLARVRLCGGRADPRLWTLFIRILSLSTKCLGFREES